MLLTQQLQSVINHLKEGTGGAAAESAVEKTSRAKSYWSYRTATTGSPRTVSTGEETPSPPRSGILLYDR
jgi:hypothetical protein